MGIKHTEFSGHPIGKHQLHLAGLHPIRNTFLCYMMQTELRTSIKPEAK
jgi:hypothetical protein